MLEVKEESSAACFYTVGLFCPLKKKNLKIKKSSVKGLYVAHDGTHSAGINHTLGDGAAGSGL